MILIMGLAGSGKGTQGKLLAEKLDYKYLSTGEFLREYITEERRRQMAEGKLIDDNEMIGIIEQFLNRLETKNESILDGFPRSGAQAQWLLQQHTAGIINIEALIYLDVPEPELIRRLIARGRHDDTEQAIRKRFEEYSKSTSPIIDDYRNRGIKIIHVNGEGPIDRIQTEIMESLKKPDGK